MSPSLETRTNTYIPTTHKPTAAQAEQEYITWVLDAYLNGFLSLTDAIRLFSGRKREEA